MSETTTTQRGFINPELLMTVAILIGMVGIVIVFLVGITTRDERARRNDELAVVQSAAIIFMDQNETDTITPRPSANAAIITSSDADAPFKTYLRSLPTYCSYYWNIDGEVTQAQCP